MSDSNEQSLNETITALRIAHDADKRELKRAITALEQIKLTALTCKNGQLGLAHIVRLCLDAGVKQKLDELEKLHPTGHGSP